MAIITRPQSPGERAIIQCADKADWTLVQAVLSGRQAYLVAMPPEHMAAEPAPRDSAKPVKPRKGLTKENGRRTGPPALDCEEARSFIEKQRKMMHCVQSVIEDQIPGGIPTRTPGTRQTNPEYNSAHAQVLRARRDILARTGGTFVDVPGKQGWVMHQE